MKRIFFLAMAGLTLGALWTSSALSAEIVVEVSSDKELYDIGETAYFTITILKNGAFLTEEETIVEATFPNEQTPVSITQVAPGIYSYSALLTTAGQMTLTASMRHDFTEALAAMKAKILRLQGEIAELEAQLADETDPKKQSQLQAKIENRQTMLAKFEEKLANFIEPEAVGMKTITVQSGVQVLITWMNCMNGASEDDTHRISMTLGEAKMEVLEDLNIPIADADLWFVSDWPFGAPFDEAKTLEELGIIERTTLYLMPFDF